jgi:hypothetical protein
MKQKRTVERDEEISMLRKMGLMLALMAFLAFPLVSWAQQGESKPAAPAPAESKTDPTGHGHRHGHGHDQAEKPGEGAGHGSAHGQGGGPHGKMGQCMAMQQEKSEKAMAAVKAMDDRLDEKLAAMKNAKGNERMAAMEAVLTELVTQRKEMRDKLGDMHHGKMMCAMMGKGGGHGMKGHGGMMGKGHKCPMMEGMQHGSGGQSGEAEAAKPETKN